MPKCDPCLAAEVKEALRKILKDGDDIKVLDSVPDCPEGVMLNLCVKEKRKRSEYQSFVSDCMREKDIHSRDEAKEGIKFCAAEWQKKKVGEI